MINEPIMNTDRETVPQLAVDYMRWATASHSQKPTNRSDIKPSHRPKQGEMELGVASRSSIGPSGRWQMLADGRKKIKWPDDGAKATLNRSTCASSSPDGRITVVSHHAGDHISVQGLNESTFTMVTGTAYLNIQRGKQPAYQSYVLRL
jgi:hypothetical protein